ncbi:TonB-dependent receptor [Permianibacter sp. IMCC34836]|uniref:TonB-dependent receptor n=1 Tax=Permianibacter fluminis TaxID=2738515 RepID=UPI00155661C0|nr:TonB-dependent receptor [Permianibacter fluminis]NQD37131.1 TonB-dependent receptor [Permianibacter fluminis]
MRRVWPACLLIAAPWMATAHAAETTELFSLSLDELARVVVTSASRKAERLIDAPATVIVLTQNDLRLRGYRELSEIFDDLPGMDVSRPYGDTWFQNQWRGIRKSISVPYLLMLDGLPLNHLYFNQAEIISALPMNEIDRVEVVYGPAAVVYGANAFVGVINVITRQQLGENGTHFTGQLRRGSFNAEELDFHYLQQRDDWRMSIAGRLDRGERDPDQADGYEWLNDRYYSDRQLWGAFVDDPDYGGRHDSPHEHSGIDVRLGWHDTELSAQYFVLESGFGSVYAADAAQNHAVWREPDLILSLRQQHQGESWQGNTILRYRESGVADNSYFLEGYNVTDEFGVTRRVVDFSYWGSENDSLALLHDGQTTLSEHWSLVAGGKYARKNLQKAYRTNYGPSVDPETLLDLADYPFPDHASNDSIPNNHIETREWSLYGQLRYSTEGVFAASDQHIVTIGLRHDGHSEYDSATSLRGGYVLSNGRWTGKVLYGESFNEPAPRELYGGWRGSGSDPQLDPETGKTLETQIAYAGPNYSLWLSRWQLRTRNDIVTFSGGARNEGEREIDGWDLGWRWKLAAESFWQTQLWGYYSYIDANEIAAGSEQSIPVGDTADNKLQFGLTWTPAQQTALTLRGRHIGSRDTVASNPAEHLDSYTVCDMTLLWRGIIDPSLSLSVTVLNLFDKDYAQPGVREAAAGFSPGSRDNNDVWQGSASFYNSLLPQEGRSIQLSFYWDI